jgi:hypothetical protein
MGIMKRRYFAKLRVAVLAVACLAMSTPTTWAGSKSPIITTVFGVYLEGVDKHGCLTDCGGQCDPFCAVLNTCTGCFVGSAKGCVANCSCRPECYLCVNFFQNCCINVAVSVYSVSAKGSACYTAIGCVSCSGNGGQA